MSLLFHRSLFGVFDIFLAIAGTAAGAYMYAKFMSRRQARHSGDVRMIEPSWAGKKTSSKSNRCVFSKNGSADSKSPKSSKKSGRSRPVKSTVSVSTPKGGMRLRTPAIQPAIQPPSENQYQSLNDASKQESSKNDSQDPDTPDNSSR